MRASPLWGLPRMLTARIGLVGIGLKLHSLTAGSLFILLPFVVITIQNQRSHHSNNMSNDSTNSSFKFKPIPTMSAESFVSQSGLSHILFHLGTKHNFKFY